MRPIAFLLLLAAFITCQSNTTLSSSIDADEDSCKNAVVFPNAAMLENAVAPGYTGVMNNYWGDDTNKLDFQHFFKNGKLIQSRFYYENGHVQEEYHFKCQSLHGESKFYAENGQLSAVLPYSYGRRHGLGVRYDSSGVIREQVVFEKDSVIRTTIFDENGKEVKE